MRSSELAQMAGVTVRTLRHYHKMGLLPEPPRRENGYREYPTAAAARLMRIKNLTSLGFPLERIKAMLDAEDAARLQAGEGDPALAVEQALDELDAQLKARIADLQNQRRIIARLKAEGSIPDVSPEHARFLAAYSAHETQPELMRYEKDALALSESLLSPSSMSLLTDFQNILMEQDLVGAYADINRRILTLPPDADEAFQQAIVDDALALFGPILDKLDLASAEGADDELADRLLESYDREQHPPGQVALIERIENEVLALIERMFEGE